MCGDGAAGSERELFAKELEYWRTESYTISVPAGQEIKSWKVTTAPQRRGDAIRVVAAGIAKEQEAVQIACVPLLLESLSNMILIMGALVGDPACPARFENPEAAQKAMAAAIREGLDLINRAERLGS